MISKCKKTILNKFVFAEDGDAEGLQSGPRFKYNRVEHIYKKNLEVSARM